VKGLIEVEILKHAEAAAKRHRESMACGEGGRIGPDFRLEKRRSALLFGPPGTSKTSLAEAVAQRLGWTFIELSPSDFLKGGLEGIYDRVNEVFDDLMDLFGAVILFDEMDALVQSRESGEAAPKELDVTQKFLTTSMLPKLLQLRKRARTIFFMATNHQKDFDPAIKRAGRFDLKIRMGPPSYKEKLRALAYDSKRSYWYKDHESEDDRNQFKQRFGEYTNSSPIQEALALFTHGEMATLFDLVRREDSRKGNARVGLEKLGKAKFEGIITTWKKEKITLRDGSAALAEYEKEDLEAIGIQ
jgi:SpoVK/Ycf46/Vps4 family AAA+-type ATPase